MTRAAGRPGDGGRRRGADGCCATSACLTSGRSGPGPWCGSGRGFRTPSSTGWRDTGAGSSRSPRRGRSTPRPCAPPAPSTATRQPPGRRPAGQASGSAVTAPAPPDRPRRRRAGRAERRRPPGHLGDPGAGRARRPGGGRRGRRVRAGPASTSRRNGRAGWCCASSRRTRPALSTWSGSARWPSAVPGCATGRSRLHDGREDGRPAAGHAPGGGPADRGPVAVGALRGPPGARRRLAPACARRTAGSVDSLHLRDAADRPSPVAGTVPRLQVTDARGPRYEIRSSVGDGDFLLVLGEGYDARWRAVVDGRDAGPPEPVDGYTSGWVLDGTRPHVVSVVFGPQRAADIALVASLRGPRPDGGVCFAAARRRPRRPVDRPPREPAGPALAPGARAVARQARLARGRRRGCALVGGWWAALAAVVLAVAHLAGRAPRPDRLMTAAAVLAGRGPGALPGLRRRTRGARCPRPWCSTTRGRTGSRWSPSSCCWSGVARDSTAPRPPILRDSAPMSDAPHRPAAAVAVPARPASGPGAQLARPDAGDPA